MHTRQTLQFPIGFFAGLWGKILFFDFGPVFIDLNRSLIFFTQLFLNSL
jgi:hypothetical protein